MKNGYHIAAIGCSAGSLDPLRGFFSNVGSKCPACFVVISHLPQNTPTRLDVLISRVTPMRVAILAEDTAPKPNHVYILPGSHRVTMVNGILKIRKRKDSEIVNTAIDEFLISLAEDQKEFAVAIILAGMGFDGSKGVKAVHEHGGIVLAQDPTTPFNSMPQAAINADHPEAILPPEQLGQILEKLLVPTD